MGARLPRHRGERRAAHPDGSRRAKSHRTLPHPPRGEVKWRAPRAHPGKDLPMTAARPLLLAALSASLGCATVSVQTEYDIKTDFSRLRTYDFITAVPGQEQAPSVRNPVVRGWVEAAIQRELAARGCSRVATGT